LLQALAACALGACALGTYALGAAAAQAPEAAAVADGSAPSAELVALGRKLFFDASLSASGKLACAGCHVPQFAYGPAPGQAIHSGGGDMTSPGVRAIPSLRYLRKVPAFALQHRFNDGDIAPIGGYTWDGRAVSLREQAKIPLLAPNEMANAGAAGFTARLRKSAHAAEFRKVFGTDVFKDPERTLDAAAEALEAFQSVPAEFYPFSSRYDAFLRGELELNEHEERGVALFKDPAKGNCASCHFAVSRAGAPPSFTDYDYANVGVPRNPRIAANADPAFFDLGLCGPFRQDLAGEQRYCGFFRSPSLRNVALRDAFFHNGVFGSLREVLKFYVERDLYPDKYYSRNADGTVHAYDDLPPGVPNNIDHDPPLDRVPGAPPALNDAEIDDLIAFLQTLTDADVAP